MAKRRVSAKQRLELVQEALNHYERTGDAGILLAQLHAALYNTLEPRPRADDNDAPF